MGVTRYAPEGRRVKAFRLSHGVADVDAGAGVADEDRSLACTVVGGQKINKK